jgi:hypothetical protein
VNGLRDAHILKKLDRACLCNPIASHDGSLLPLPNGEKVGVRGTGLSMDPNPLTPALSPLGLRHSHIVVEESIDV